MWIGYQVTAKLLKPLKIAYYPGEELVRSWTIFNEGDEPLNNLFVLLTDGYCCCNL
jgi:uncharacterized membrane protein